MKDNKKTVVYARTASNKQGFDLQLEAAKPFLRGVQEEHIVIITETAALGLSHQVGLQKITDLVKNDQVDTLIVYQRDRLARNVYDYLEIIKIFYAHQVKVIFTASGLMPFNSEKESGALKEFLFLSVIEKERKFISNRIKAGFESKPV